LPVEKKVSALSAKNHIEAGFIQIQSSAADYTKRRDRAMTGRSRCRNALGSCLRVGRGYLQSGQGHHPSACPTVANQLHVITTSTAKSPTAAKLATDSTILTRPGSTRNNPPFFRLSGKNAQQKEV
jgi:hypothetical protein